jgi:acetoin utilization deacetylase AcuC-like enzyme
MASMLRRPVFISHADCLKHEMGVHHPECPERLTAIHDHLLMKGLLDDFEQLSAPQATEQQLERAHTALHVRKIIAAAPSSGYVMLDPDTRLNPYTVSAALRAAGAAILATDLVLQNQVPSAFCAVRPPGHHASRDQAMGFCFFNNIAVAIRHALEVHGLQRITLIDFDVHHGNGSEDIFYDDPRVLMCSTFEVDLYPFCGQHPRGPNMINIGLAKRSDGKAFRQAVQQHWLPALDHFQPQMLFISAGFDAHCEDELGNLVLTEHDYEWVTREIRQLAERHSQGRIVSCLEGGYALSALARSVAAHCRVLAE